MNSTDVNELWISILQYVDSEREVGNEGNSGEFHDPNELHILCTISTSCLETLINKFGKLTKHNLVKYKVKNRWHEKWVPVEKGEAS